MQSTPKQKQKTLTVDNATIKLTRYCDKTNLTSFYCIQTNEENQYFQKQKYSLSARTDALSI